MCKLVESTTFVRNIFSDFLCNKRYLNITRQLICSHPSKSHYLFSRNRDLNEKSTKRDYFYEWIFKNAKSRKYNFSSGFITFEHVHFYVKIWTRTDRKETFYARFFSPHVSTSHMYVNFMPCPLVREPLSRSRLFHRYSLLLYVSDAFFFQRSSTHAWAMCCAGCRKTRAEGCRSEPFGSLQLTSRTTQRYLQTSEVLADALESLTEERVLGNASFLNGD